jgi:hypothetical protein
MSTDTAPDEKIASLKQAFEAAQKRWRSIEDQCTGLRSTRAKVSASAPGIPEQAEIRRLEAEAEGAFSKWMVDGCVAPQPANNLAEIARLRAKIDINAEANRRAQDQVQKLDREISALEYERGIAMSYLRAKTLDLLIATEVKSLHDQHVDLFNKIAQTYDQLAAFCSVHNFHVGGTPLGPYPNYSHVRMPSFKFGDPDSVVHMVDNKVLASHEQKWTDKIDYLAFGSTPGGSA